MGIIRGADLGWATQLEDMGYYWKDDEGRTGDILDIMKSYNISAIRFRLFVDPPADAFWDKTPTERCMMGYCRTEDVLKMARRVKSAGLKVMLTVHYSDYFADPNYQILPRSFENHTEEQLIEDVRRYTLEVMEAFRAGGVQPDWVQVGNETNTGMMLPYGDAKSNMKLLSQFLNAGYDAVKAIFPDTVVITHLACGAVRDQIRDWFDSFFAEGGRTDLIGLSHYPYWYKTMPDITLSDLSECLKDYYAAYKKPIMVVEVGEDNERPDDTYDLIKETISALESVPDNMGQGVFYWEPEAPREVLPDGYPLGASTLTGDKEITFTRAMRAFM